MSFYKNYLCHFIKTICVILEKLFVLFYKNFLCYSIKKTFFVFIYIYIYIYILQHIIKMKDLKLNDLNLSLEESRYIIEFLA